MLRSNIGKIILLKLYIKDNKSLFLSIDIGVTDNIRKVVNSYQKKTIGLKVEPLGIPAPA